MSIAPQPSSRLLAQSPEVRNHFESQLEPTGLSEPKILDQPLEELRESLARIDEAIKNPSSFGTIRVSLTPDGNVFIAKAGSDYLQKVGILPLLLEREKADSRPGSPAVPRRNRGNDT